MNTFSPAARKRGSVLFTTLFIALITTVLLATLLQVSSRSMRFSDRTHLVNRANALTEAGIEEGLSALRRNTWATEGWTIVGNDAVKTITETPPDGITDEIKVRVTDYLATGTSAPKVYAQGRCLTGGGGTAVASQLRIDTTREPFFSGALVALRKMKLMDHVLIDSYDSRLGPYGGTNMGYDAVVAVLDPVKTKDFTINKTEIRGFVRSGGIAPKISNGATVIGPNSVSRGRGPGNLDPSRVSQNYAEPYPVVSAPTTYHFYEDEMKNPTTLGTAGGSPITYQVRNFKVENNKTTSVAGVVRIVVLENVDISGNLNIASTGSLELWVLKNFKLDGNGSILIAGNDPRKMIIFGNDRPPDKKVKGTFDFKGKDENYYGAIYAPSTRIKIEKGGDFFGSIVGNNIEIKKAGSFHQDMSLAKFAGNVDTWLKDGGRTGVYFVARWNTSLSTSEKALFAF